MNQFLDNVFGSKNLILMLYARNCIFTAAKVTLEKRPNKNVCLVPSYSCGDEINAIIKAGYEVVVYKINRDLSIDLDDIESKINKSVGLFLQVDYFGIKDKQAQDLLKLLSKKGVSVIYDRAHHFPILKENTYSYDFVVYSLRKVLNLPYGGLLQINNIEYVNFNFDLKSPSVEAVDTEKYIYYAKKIGIYPKGTNITDIYKSLGLEIDSIHGARLSGYGGYALLFPKESYTDLFNELERSESYYRLLEECKSNLSELSNRGTIFHKYLEDSNSKSLTSFIPLLVKNKNSVLEKCKSRGIQGIYPFWTYLHSFVNWANFPEAVFLKNNLLVVDYRLLTEKSISEILNVLKNEIT